MKICAVIVSTPVRLMHFNHHFFIDQNYKITITFESVPEDEYVLYLQRRVLRNVKLAVSK